MRLICLFAIAILAPPVTFCQELPGASDFAKLARDEDAAARTSVDPAVQSAKRQEAIENYKKAIDLATDDPNLRFQLANLEVFAVNRAIASKSQNPEQRPSEADREALKAEYFPLVNDAIAQTEKCLELLPGRRLVMLQLYGAHMLRAGLEGRGPEALHDMDVAGQWEARYRRASNPEVTLDLERKEIAMLVSPTPDLVLDGGPRAAINPIPRTLISDPPPSRFDGEGAKRIGRDEAQANLLNKIEPVYPNLAIAARVQGTVEFLIRIDTSGRVVNIQLVRGHPLLVNAAKMAVQQWEYRPFLDNGNPSAVVTNVEIPFRLPPQ